MFFLSSSDFWVCLVSFLCFHPFSFVYLLVEKKNSINGIDKKKGKRDREEGGMARTSVDCHTLTMGTIRH